MAKPKIKSKFKIRREASNSALARLRASQFAEFDANYLKKLQPKLDSSDPRTVWLAKEVLCALKYLKINPSIKSISFERFYRCYNELFQHTEECADGRILRVYPIAQLLDHNEIHHLRAHRENELCMVEDSGDCCLGFQVHVEDFLDFEEYQESVNRNYPHIFSDNPYYGQIPKWMQAAWVDTPIFGPLDPTYAEALAKPTITREQIVDHLAALEPYEYESYRLVIAKKLGVRVTALDKEVLHQRMFLFGKAGV